MAVLQHRSMTDITSSIIPPMRFTTKVFPNFPRLNAAPGAADRYFLSCPSARFLSSSATTIMVIPPPVRPPRIINYLKPYVLRMHFSNKYVSTQVVHTPTATVAASASSKEKLLRPTMESTRDVAAASKIGKILGERLLLKGIPAVSVFLKREQKYHGKVKAVIDSVRDAGVKLL
ncbi:Ribosomal L18p/L5e family [Musa troglodytarum]|uniref:Ribosomal L18p/L5e family n=1 Tax=Musa troglodytarum TaxID=320322 RepID=A0A9E7EVU9_9LILI|nr:Ribosomal L18p/L5e family [Musa troglodytarum]